MKNGQKYGLKSSIKKTLVVIKKNVLITTLVVTFFIWIVVGINYNSHNILSELNNDVEARISGEKEISGIAKVLDGDSVVLSNNYEVRLIGIDAPEYKQKCFNKDNNEYFCGKMATNFLKDLVSGKKVTCFYDKKDIYDRYLGRCYLDNENVNNELLKNGMAIIYSFGEVAQNLQEIEDSARERKVGVWQGAFLEPRVYRKKNKNKKDT